jgi:hypothetical protein
VYTGSSVIGVIGSNGAITALGLADMTISNWRGAETSAGYSVLTTTATLPESLDPATLQITGGLAAGGTFTATANAAGVFATAHVTGTYEPATGALALTFAAPTTLATLAYTATLLAPQASVAPLWGLDESKFATDGTVPVIRPGQVAVLRHADTVAPATYANGATLNVGRTDLADVRVIDANGLGVPTGWTANLATGIVTFNSVGGWAQPVRVRHAIEHVALVLATPNQGAAVLSRSPGRVFPVGSLLCSALLLGDLQAQAGAAWAQGTWTDVWSNAVIGAPIAPQYQQAANPIGVSNLGAVTERWALIFRTSTSYRVVGETLGEISQGDINSTLAPVNPATGTPYFTLAATGWGSGWSAGNVLRFNTQGAAAPVWVARTVLPSAPSSAADSITIAVRGDIDQ